jgi:hypothetical protein
MEHSYWLNAQSLALWFYNKVVVKIFNNDIIAKILGFFLEKECSKNEDPTSFNQHNNCIIYIYIYIHTHTPSLPLCGEGMGGNQAWAQVGARKCLECG